MADGDTGQVALYNKYRPRRFSDVAGQREVEGLRTAVTKGNIKHAYLFKGTHGCGKTSTARILAAAVNCGDLGDNGEPCGACSSCVATFSGSHVGVVHELDAATNRGIDHVRDLFDSIDLGVSANRKVYIIDEVHRLTRDASTAMLRRLEEPPRNVIFILCTTEPDAIESTIRSRTQQISFRRITDDLLEGMVRDISSKEGIELSDDDMRSVVSTGNGSPRDTLSALDNAAIGVVSDDHAALLKVASPVVEGDVAGTLLALAELDRDEALNPKMLGTGLLGLWRDAMLFQQNPEVVSVSPRFRDSVETASKASPAKVIKHIEELARCVGSMRDSTNQRVSLEATLVKLMSPSARSQLDGVMASLDDLRQHIDARLDRVESAMGTGTWPSSPPEQAEAAIAEPIDLAPSGPSPSAQEEGLDEGQEQTQEPEPTPAPRVDDVVVPLRDSTVAGGADHNDADDEVDGSQDDAPEDVAGQWESIVEEMFSGRVLNLLLGADVSTVDGALTIQTDRNLPSRAQERIQERVGDCVFERKPEEVTA